MRVGARLSHLRKCCGDGCCSKPKRDGIVLKMSVIDEYKPWLQQQQKESATLKIKGYGGDGRIMRVIYTQGLGGYRGDKKVWRVWEVMKSMAGLHGVRGGLLVAYKRTPTFMGQTTVGSQKIQMQRFMWIATNTTLNTTLNTDTHF